MKTAYFNTKKTARYYQLGDFGNHTQRVWFVLHGYMQLAKYFISKFKILDDGKNIIIAPEALSRAYIEGTAGHVGASWMTKEDRETEITDYVNYLDSLYENLAPEIPQNAEIIVLGFSQGVATAARWVANGKINPGKLILWAGVFPPDMNMTLVNEKFKNIPVTALIGNNDQYFSVDGQNNPLKILDENNISYQLIQYEGGHNIYDDVLLDLVKN